MAETRMRANAQVPPANGMMQGGGMHAGGPNQGPVYLAGPKGHVPAPGLLVDPPCKWTCCFCCGCTYSARCVYKTFHVCDCVNFGWWGFHGFIYLAFIGTYALIGAALGLGLFALAYLALMNCLKLDEHIASKVLNDKTNFYLTWRFRTLMAILGMGVLLGILYFILIYVVGKSALEEANGGKSDEFTDAAAALLFTLGLIVMFAIIGSYLDLVLWLMGYKKSATDSLALLEKPRNPGEEHGSVIMGEVSVINPNQGPVYAGNVDNKPNAKLQPAMAPAPPIKVEQKPSVNVNAAFAPPQQAGAPTIAANKPQQSMAVPVANQGVAKQASATLPAKTASKTGGTGVKKFKAAPK